jgi:hypothetical protein
MQCGQYFDIQLECYYLCTFPQSEWKLSGGESEKITIWIPRQQKQACSILLVHTHTTTIFLAR